MSPAVNNGFDAGTSLTTAYGSRALFTFITANGAPGDARGRTAVANGLLTFSSDDEVTGFGFVSYAFNTPIDLSANAGFEFAIRSNDQPGAVILTAIDSVGNESQYQYTVPIPLVNPSTPVTFFVPDFFAIDNSSATPTDLTQVRQLQFAFGGIAGEDLSIDSLQTVSLQSIGAPEPASLGVVALALGVSLRRRRRVA